MTISRARELLGNKIAHLTDDEVLHFLHQTDKALDVFFTLAVKDIESNNFGKLQNSTNSL